METTRHHHSRLIDAIGRDAVVQVFGLSHQALYAWRQRGIPALRRIAFAKLAAEHGVTMPDGFFDDFETLPKGRAA